ncbi:MAG: cupin domain-containing protein [Candidatus Eremiobacteraeota bacterium]|nr:cupin domain-containing protein [Candidatus Eremiobacteraeota bacterium]
MDVARHVHHVPAGNGPCVTYPNNVINLKLTALESAGEMTVLEDVIPPQAGPPLHVHSRENEAYYVLEGEFEFTCGSDMVRGGPGTFVHSPRGIPHRYQNVGAVPGRLLISFTPAGIEAFFRELGDEKALNPQRMAEIMGKHGITLATRDS